MKLYSLFLSILVGIILIYPPPSTATTWYILPDGSGGAPTIQAGIDLADTGDIVELADGTYTGYGNRDLDFLGKAITVRSMSGNPETCIIDCESGPDSYRGFLFQSGEGNDSVLEGVTIKNGRHFASGSGIYCYLASPTIRNVIFKENRGSSIFGGAGFYCGSSSPIIIDCIFWENQCEGVSGPGSGGGALSFESTPTFNGCIFYGNSVDSSFDSGGAGAGLSLQSSDANVSNCSFINNSIGPSNMGIGLGAGILVGNGAAVIEFCTFSGNTTSSFGAGGAVATYGECNVDLISCTMFGNESYLGTVHLQGGEVEISNTVIANNLLSEWTRFDEPGAVVVWEGFVSLNCCDVYDNESGDWEGAIADQFGINGNISEDPLFCDADNGDFSIRSDSPCSPEFTPDCGLIGALDVGCEAPSGLTDGPNPAAFRLDQAYPNPFNPQTKITFYTNEPQQVRVEVYDIRGSLIALLTDQQYQTGEHSVEWQGRDSAGRAVPSGEYFFRVEIGGQVETRKAMLLR